uniref:Uncharacterized protein n=1 Tax=Oryza sativa subsp. japonica TaxID=39947 RepID=Q6H5L6_ORYSJ|nr:hypothetical protein [Oryza sativa Japonica Group]BAD25983.1 hypothetical protein [Oryza sativa Japonica Group]
MAGKRGNAVGRLRRPVTTEAREARSAARPRQLGVAGERRRRVRQLEVTGEQQREEETSGSPSPLRSLFGAEAEAVALLILPSLETAAGGERQILLGERMARVVGRARRAAPRTLEAAGYRDEFAAHPRRPRARLFLRRLRSNLLSFPMPSPAALPHWSRHDVPSAISPCTRGKKERREILAVLRLPPHPLRARYAALVSASMPLPARAALASTSLPLPVVPLYCVAPSPPAAVRFRRREKSAASFPLPSHHPL